MLNNLDEYILEIKEKIKTIPDITELELIRYVYLDLGNKISFDETLVKQNKKYINIILNSKKI